MCSCHGQIRFRGVLVVVAVVWWFLPFCGCGVVVSMAGSWGRLVVLRVSSFFCLFSCVIFFEGARNSPEIAGGVRWEGAKGEKGKGSWQGGGGSGSQAKVA